MKNKFSIINLALVSACLVAGFGCGYLNRSDANSSNSNKAGANTASNTSSAVNKRDPKKFCYLEGFSAGDSEYKASGSGYQCLTVKNGPLPSGGFHSINYGAYGDANNVDRVSLMMLASTKRPGVAESDESFAQASGELWQRVFNASMPNDIKEAIVADKGKAVKMEKKFAAPAVGKATREPGNGGTYTLRFELTLPK